jgi:hypothetical protein
MDAFWKETGKKQILHFVQDDKPDTQDDKQIRSMQPDPADVRW